MRHLLDFNDWSRADLESLLETVHVMSEVLERPVKKVPALQGFTVCTAFFENSTRTRLSFELAARRMSADVLSFTSASSSLAKGESLRDTAQTLAAMHVDLFVVRHMAAGTPQRIATWTQKSVINAGDVRRAHPTQALVDAHTLHKRFDRLEGLEVAIIGDVAHSRVARSNAELLPKLGANVRLCGPATLLPPELKSHGITLTTRAEEAVEGAHAIIALRLQRERMDAALLPSLEEYRARYCVNETLLKHAREDAVVLSPGPMNRDVEIEGTLADSARSLVTQQVEHGLPVRMAALYHLLVGRRNA